MDPILIASSEKEVLQLLIYYAQKFVFSVRK